MADVAPQGTHNGTSQRVLFGINSLRNVGEAISSLPASRILIVSGKSIQSTPLVDVLHKLEPTIEMYWYPEVRRHTPTFTIRDGVNAVSHNNIDALVAIGGGSAIDTAKAIAAAHRDSSNSDTRYRYNVPSTTLPIVAIPTTLSQAEFTPIAGVTDTETGEKTVIRDPSLMPSIVILDGEAAAHTPHELWIGSAIKALDTAFGALLQYDQEQPFWDPLLLKACEQLYSELSLYSYNRSATSRQKQQVAAWMAVFPKFHLPVDQSLPDNETWIGSTLRHQIGGLSGKAHGDIAAILLVESLRFHLAHTVEKQTRLANHLGLDGPDEMHASLSSLVSKFGLSSRLRDLNIEYHDLPKVIRNVAKEVPSYGDRKPEIAHLLHKVF